MYAQQTLVLIGTFLGLGGREYNSVHPNCREIHFPMNVEQQQYYECNFLESKGSSNCKVRKGISGQSFNSGHGISLPSHSRL